MTILGLVAFQLVIVFQILYRWGHLIRMIEEVYFLISNLRIMEEIPLMYLPQVAIYTALLSGGSLYLSMV